MSPGVAESPLRDIQANLARVTKYAGNATRDWSLFFFFRVMKAGEIEQTRLASTRMRNALNQPDDEADGEKVRNDLARELRGMRTRWANAGVFDVRRTSDIEQQDLPDQRLGPAPAAADAPAPEFFAWLKLVSTGTRDAILAALPRPEAPPSQPGETKIPEGEDLDRLLESSRAEGVGPISPEICEIVVSAALAGRTNGALDKFLDQAASRLDVDRSDLIAASAVLLSERVLDGQADTGGSSHFHAAIWLSDQIGKDISSDDTADQIVARYAGTPEETATKQQSRIVAGKIILAFLFLFRRDIHDAAKTQALFDAMAGLRAGLDECPLLASALLQGFSAIFRLVLSSDDGIVRLVSAFGAKPAEAGQTALNGRLPTLCLFEILRHLASSIDVTSIARAMDKPRPLSRNIAEDAAPVPTGPRSAAGAPTIDPAPIDIAFTFSGLQMLQLHPDTLLSFPAAFQEGMAARAGRLGDTGPSAPESWDGELGLKSVHGFFTGGFQVGDDDYPVKEDLWRAVREDIRLFNGRVGPRGNFLRALLGALFRPYGMEIVHIELGQDPYRVENGDVRKLSVRQEHFGFHDGISQPFVDMGLKDATAGGGTPDRDRTWSAVAPGEIYLGHPDEDGNLHHQPASQRLRDNGTYLVFRKLEQDVIGFRNFLRRLRPDKSDQERLAARFVGRWKNGAPLVSFPDAPVILEGDARHRLNDFLYAADDPRGMRCPLGSHIRRSNPRDIGNGDEVRRHRILRRSISYGGPLLAEDADDDSQRRGLLFVAANSRLEQQFEVIQGDWINGSEFLGQAGLGRCPLTGTNDGTFWDMFFESGAVSPIAQLPRFVITRGGDYFFAPSATALRELAKGEVFPPDKAVARGIGNARTPILFEERRITDYVRRLAFGMPAIRIAMPDLASSASFPVEHVPKDLDPRAGKTVVFVGNHDDVREILRDNGDTYRFSVAHYRETARRVTRGGDVLIATEKGGETAAARDRLRAILDKAWSTFVRDTQFYDRWEAIVDDQCNKAVRRALRSGRMDVVQDLATDAVYGFVGRFYGITGPDWLTELAVALPFTRQHVGQLHPDWLAAQQGQAPRNPRMMTLQIWSIVFLADLIANVSQMADLKSLSDQACSEFLNHLEDLLTAARRHPPRQSLNLIDAFVATEAAFVTPGAAYDTNAYYRDVSAILLELTAATMANIPTIFGELMNTLLTNRVDLAALLPLLTRPMPDGDKSGVTRLIYETDRLNPAFGLFLRHCEQDTRLSATGTDIKRGEWVLALLNAANLDGRKFESPLTFSLHPFLPGPERPLANYLLFGALNSGRDCWGRDRFALRFLERLIRSLGTIQGMRKVPGPQGELMKLLRVNIGLHTRFARVPD